MEKSFTISGLGELKPQEGDVATLEQPKVEVVENKAVETQVENVQTEEKRVEPTITKEEVNKVVAEKKEDTKAEEIKKEEVAPAKSFEELLTERSGGKYKSWDEIEKTVTANPYADETIAKINEYVKSGGTVDDWISTQSINIEELNPAEKIAMQMSIADPDMTEKEIELEMKLKYGFDKWKDNVEDYEEGIEPDDIKIMKMRFERESLKAEKQITEYQKKWSVPQVDVEGQKKQQELLQQNWDSNVDETIKSVTKIPIKVSDKETFDYVISPEEQKEANRLVKEMFTNSNALFTGLADPKKPMGVNIEGLTEMVIRSRNFDKILTYAVNQAKSAGGHEVVKDIKNISFTTDGKKQEPKAASIEQQIASAMSGRK